MMRNEFIQEIFLQLYPLFIDELLEYDEALGKNTNTISDIYTQAFANAAIAADIAAAAIEMSKDQDHQFWEKTT